MSNSEYKKSRDENSDLNCEINECTSCARDESIFKHGADWSRDYTVKEIVEWLRSNETYGNIGTALVAADQIERRFLRSDK